MDRLSSDEMLQNAFILLKFIGEDKLKLSKRLLLFRVLNSTVLVLLGIFTGINFLYATTETYVKTLQALLAILHVLLKYILIMQHKFQIELLIRDTTAFWNYENFDANIQLTTKRTAQAIINLQNLLLSVSLVITFMYFLRPTLDSDYIYLLEIWSPESYAIDAFLQISQYYYFVIGLVVVFSYDFIYLVLCVHIAIQMKLLKHKIIQDLKEDCNLKVHGCIKYHQFLQTMFYRMKNVYSLLLLSHYFMTLISTCSEFYELVVKNAGFSHIIIKFLSVLIFFGQFAYYTFPAEQIAFEFSDLADALYSSKWYNYSEDLKRTILFTMMRSQRIEYFTGAGLIDINVATFGSVFRKILSFYAVLTNILDK